MGFYNEFILPRKAARGRGDLHLPKPARTGPVIREQTAPNYAG
jgi:hypothetical protein